MDEVDHCVNLLKDHARAEDPSKNRHGLKIWALPMYGSLPPNDQLKVFRPGGRGTRKVVVATNIAETSITIEGIAYVVDSCFVKMKWYNPDTNVDALIITEVVNMDRLITNFGFGKLSEKWVVFKFNKLIFPFPLNFWPFLMIFQSFVRGVYFHLCGDNHPHRVRTER